jgi:hypothetical protein
MADFRKWLVAFALVATLLGLATTASASGVTGGLATPMTCVANAATNKDVRIEGVAELTGDIVLTCTGGTPTPINQYVPLANIHVTLPANIPITSRTMGTANPLNSSEVVIASEAILLIDEPFPSGHQQPPDATAIGGAPHSQIGCQAFGGASSASTPIGQCDIKSVDGIGVKTYLTQYNTFQGIADIDLLSGKAAIDFLGVPIDAPGTTGARIIRITNLRGDMRDAPVAPNNVVATLTFPSNPGITLNQDSFVVATAFQGLQPGAVKNGTYNQCVPEDDSGGQSITFSEGFASAFKTAQLDDLDLTGSGNLNAIRTDTDHKFLAQNVTNVSTYYTETGFTPYVAKGVLIGSDPAAGAGTIGVADYGTRFIITVQNLQNGVSLAFPGTVTGGTASPNLILYLVKSPNSDGTGSAATWVTSSEVLKGSWTPTSGATSQFVVYEVVSDNPNLQETVTVAPTVSYTPNLPLNVPALNNPGPSIPTVATALVGLAPIAADSPGLPLNGPPFPNGPGVQVVPGSDVGSLPRFGPGNEQASPLVTINPCSCNLLFPWIVSGSGLETGMAVVNTSPAPSIWNPGSKSQSGTITLWFWGTRGGASVAGEFHPNTGATPAETAIVVPGGCAFTLYTAGGSNVNCVPVPAGNGSISSAVTEGFVGYVIATTTFQYCHGVAYVALANSLQGSYYEAIELDTPFALSEAPETRTGQLGESQAH